ncbi:TPA: c-type cytochrome biogenesis protein CcmI [Enterobacter hormaechei]|nr:c-type cytochrome biogenesis protein CcmI [Enterobacter hormaechei]
MILFVTIIVLLLAVTLALIYFPWQERVVVDRDTLNRAFYASRLQDLHQEDPAAGEAIVLELQRTLLADTSQASTPTARPLSRWVLLPGALALVPLSLGIFLKTSDMSQVMLWQQAEHQMPVLLRQAQDPQGQPLQMDELAQLRLGLRSQLQTHPDDLAGWQMLGRIGLLLNDTETAIGAFEKAYQLAPHDPRVSFDYASVLVHRGNKSQMMMGEQLLQELHQSQPQNLKIIELLALSAMRNDDYPGVVSALQKMTDLLPPDDPERKMLLRSLSEAQTKIR